MAIVKFGGIVTIITGSVGGQTFRYSGGIGTLYNKPNTLARRYSSNKGKPTLLMSLNHEWTTITQAERDAWASEATKFKRTDRFGNTTDWSPKDFFVFIRGNQSKFNNNKQQPINLVDDLDLPTGFDVFVTQNRNINILNNGFIEPYYLGMNVYEMSSNARRFHRKRYKFVEIAHVIDGTNIIWNCNRFGFQVPFPLGKTYAIAYTIYNNNFYLIQRSVYYYQN